jgi:hypothetical protein
LTIELKRHDATLTEQERDRAVDDFIALVVAATVPSMQAKADAAYSSQFATARFGRRGRPFGDAPQAAGSTSFRRDASPLPGDLKGMITSPKWDASAACHAPLEYGLRKQWAGNRPFQR